MGAGTALASLLQLPLSRLWHGEIRYDVYADCSALNKVHRRRSKRPLIESLAKTMTLRAFFSCTIRVADVRITSSRAAWKTVAEKCHV